MFYEEYVDDVFTGIKNVIVTDQTGNEVSIQKAMDLWSEKAKMLRDKEKGVIFFCGHVQQWRSICLMIGSKMQK